MSNFIRFCVLALISGWIIPATTLAAPSAAFPQQATPSPAADADKQPSAPAKPHQPRPNPDADGKYHIGDGVTAPKLIHVEEPELSKKLRKEKFDATCLLSLTVDANGNPTDVHIFKSIADSVDQKLRATALELDENSIKAVKKYRFTPATYEGKPVPVELHVAVNFQRF